MSVLSDQTHEQPTPGRRRRMARTAWVLVGAAPVRVGGGAASVAIDGVPDTGVE